MSDETKDLNRDHDRYMTIRGANAAIHNWVKKTERKTHKDRINPSATHETYWRPNVNYCHPLKIAGETVSNFSNLKFSSTHVVSPEYPHLNEAPDELNEALMLYIIENWNEVLKAVLRYMNQKEKDALRDCQEYSQWLSDKIKKAIEETENE